MRESNFAVIGKEVTEEMKKKLRQERIDLTTQYPHLYVSDYDQFLEMLFPPHYEGILRKGALKNCVAEDEENEETDDNEMDNEQLSLQQTQQNSREEEEDDDGVEIKEEK